MKVLDLLKVCIEMKVRVYSWTDKVRECSSTTHSRQANERLTFR
jgi:hypothetical protein